MSENEIRVKAYMRDGKWEAVYQDVLASADSLPQVVDALVTMIFAVEAACLSQGVTPPVDILAFCRAYRTRAESIWWAVVMPQPLEFVRIDFEITDVN